MRPAPTPQKATASRRPWGHTRGLIASETATSLTLRRADSADRATDTILRIDIDELKSTGMSLIPEGLEKQIDQQAMADLLEFLRAAEESQSRSASEV